MTTMAKLFAKLNRLELTVCIVAAVLLAAAAIWSVIQLNEVGTDRTCLIDWVTSVPTSPGCTDAVMRFGTINEDLAAKVMAALAIVPFAIGAILGSPLVAREFEEGTAPLTWSLAASRARWLWIRFVPAALIVVILCLPLAVASTALVETRTVGGIWYSPYDMASLYGAPVLAHGIAALAIATAAGAIAGRTLSALVLTVVFGIALAVAVMTAQASFARPGLLITDIGAPGYVAKFLAFNPDNAVLFVAPSGDILSLDEAKRSVPAATADVAQWLQDNYRFVPLGIKTEKATQWQLVETTAYAVVSVGSLVLAAGVVGVRRPSS